MRSQDIKKEDNSRLVKMLERKHYGLDCPLCPPNHRCNQRKFGRKKYKTKKAFQLRRLGKKYY